MSKVTQTRDVQAQTFGFAPNVTSAFAVTQNTTCTISALVVTSAAVTARSTDDAIGMMILASSNATFGTAGTVAYGVVLKNTSGTTPAFTVDAWYNLAGVKQSGTFANSGLFYVLLPVAPPFWYIALTDSTSAVAGTETGTALGGTEIITNGLTRAQVTTVTRTIGSTSATMALTFTYTGSGAQAIGRCAITNSQIAGTNTNNIGNFAYFIDQVNGGVAATVSANGDTFTPTYTLTLG